MKCPRCHKPGATDLHGRWANCPDCGLQVKTDPDGFPWGALIVVLAVLAIGVAFEALHLWGTVKIIKSAWGTP